MAKDDINNNKLLDKLRENGILRVIIFHLHCHFFFTLELDQRGCINFDKIRIHK